MISPSLLDQGHVRLKQCRHGPMLYLVTDLYVGQSLDRYGEYCEEENALLRRIVRPGWMVLDIGANMGAHTVSLAQATGPKGVVLALEPQRVIFQILCANVALNALGNVHANQVAVGREAGTVIVPNLDYSEVNNYGGVPLSGWSEGERVSLVTVDSLDLSACHLVKIDVEGMEGDVVAGAEQTIRRFHPVLYLENDRPEHSATLIRQILDLGYRLYWHLPHLFNPQNYFEVAENVFGWIVSVNMLGLPASVPQDVQGLHEITDPGDQWPGELRKIRPEERRDSSHQPQTEPVRHSADH
jgi:FkbM family methyltransferase